MRNPHVRSDNEDYLCPQPFPQCPGFKISSHDKRRQRILVLNCKYQYIQSLLVDFRTTFVYDLFKSSFKSFLSVADELPPTSIEHQQPHGLAFLYHNISASTMADDQQRSFQSPPKATRSAEETSVLTRIRPSYLGAPRFYFLLYFEKYATRSTP